MTTPTPLGQTRNRPRLLTNQRMPRSSMNVVNRIPSGVLARAQQIKQQRMTQMSGTTNLPSTMLSPQMNKSAVPQLQSQSMAPVESVPTNPITGQLMSPEAYQAQFGTITAPNNNINYSYSLMAPPSLGNNVNPITGQSSNTTQTNQLNYLHSLPMETMSTYVNPLTGQSMTEEEYQQMLNQQMLAPGYSSNQLMPQQQIAGTQAVATQPRIF